LLTLGGPRDIATVLIREFSGERNILPKLSSVKLRPIGNQQVGLRAGTSDARVVLDVFVGRFHVPPAEVTDPGLIVDLGANIGLTVAHYAELFPNARVVGLEPEPEMAMLAEKHTAPWGDRCTIHAAAIWSADGELSLSTEPGQEFASTVASPTVTKTDLVVKALSLNTLLEDETSVGYMKMDIEGAEGEVLSTNTEWAEKVQCINVEIHPPNTVESVTARLNELGFETEPIQRHWAAVIGFRR
jgi:FkbM family methyltransferase